MGGIVASLGFSESWGIENPKINGTIWYISVLLICYVVFYFCTWISSKLNVGSEKLYILMIFLGMAIRNAQVNDFIFVSVSTSRGYTAFFTGILLALILKKYKPKIVNYIFSILIVVSVPVLLYKYNVNFAVEFH